MASGRLARVVPHLRRAVLGLDGAGLPDADLLDGFVARRDEDAFAILVRRHGPMVLGVCQRVLGNTADAEDAFQATFLVLVRKAAAIVPRSQVGNWLYGVAVNTARKAKAMTRNRRTKERQAAARPAPEEPSDDWQQLQAQLDEQLSLLPDKYRVPIVLCDLEGKPLKEVARQLGWPQGTVASRLSRGRTLLAQRLKHGGLLLSSGAPAAILTTRAALAVVPGPLFSSTVKVAVLFAAEHVAAGAIPAPVAALTEGVLKAMLMTKLKIVAGLLLMVGAVGIGAAGLAYEVRAGETPMQSTKPVQETTPFGLRDAPPSSTPVPTPMVQPPIRVEDPAKNESTPSIGPLSGSAYRSQSSAKGTEREVIEQLLRALKGVEPQTMGLPVGRWHIEFSNGEKTICEILKNGTVVQGETKIDGRAAVKDAVTIVVLRDGQILRWTPVGPKMVVEHWANSTHYQSSRPTLGIAERVSAPNTPLYPGGLQATPKPPEGTPKPPEESPRDR